jgi:anti-sigma-K factor RskA
MEKIMLPKSLWRGVLIVALSVAVAAPARANSLDTAGRNIVIGIVAVTAAIAVVITVVILHESRKDRTITGCVSSEGNGMTIADEKDQQVYALSGNTVGITLGERMSLKGKKARSKNTNHTLVWVTTNMDKDLGVCRP